MAIGQCVTLAAILLIMFRLPMAATYAALAMYADIIITAYIASAAYVDCVFHTQTGR